MSYFNGRDYNYPQRVRQGYNVDNLLYDVGLPTVLGFALGPLFGIGLAGFLSSNRGQNTNIVNINTRKRNNCYYDGFQ